jgi:insulysin
MNTHNLISPKVDDNKYKFIKLDNKMDVLIIYNKETDISATAMTVEAGFYDDPYEYQGLAHFLEHMLFMGTTKHKQENFFNKFINESGGITNAHTTEEFTTFYYQVLNEHFTESLEIFSYFFSDALLSETAIEREINAVNSEHRKNLTNDIFRTPSILKELVTNNHPYYNFGTGNKETLTKKNIRDILFDLYNKYYSANLMKLVVLSNIDIETMEKIIIKHFSKIKNKNVSRPIIEKMPFNKDNDDSLCMHLIKCVPIQDIDTLTIIWQLPDMDKYYKYKPLDYISYLLGHEAEGGIYYALKNNDYISSLYAGTFDDDSSMTLYKLDITLTSKGFKYIPSIIDCVNEYIKLIIKNGINKTIYDELKIINQLSFDYSSHGENIDYVAYLSMNMLKYEPEDIIYGPYKMNEFNDKIAKIINECLSYMNNDNSILIISSKTYDDIAVKTEKWYSAKYINVPCKKNYGKEFNYKKIDYNLHLPNNNNFVPKNVNLEKNIIMEFPKRVKSDYEIWYKKDNEFKIPKIYHSIILYIDEHYKSALNFLITQIYFKIIDEELGPIMYYANLALSGYDVSIRSNCIILKFYGFNETINQIIDLYINALFDIKITEKLFNYVKYDIKMDFKNFIYNPAYILVGEYFREKIFKLNYTNEELLEELHNINIKNMELPKKWFMNNCYIKSFIYGNINDKIIRSNDNIYKKFKSNNKQKNNIANQVIQLSPSEQQIYIKKIVNKTDDNFVIFVFFEIDNIIRNDTKNNKWKENIIYTSLIELHVKENFFTQLRTKEQLGYIVRSSLQYYQSNKGFLLGLSYLIQSPDSNPVKLKKRIRSFVNDMFIELNELSDEKLNTYKVILKRTLSKKFNSQDEEFNFLNYEIVLGDNMFNYRKILINYIDKITKDNLIKFYNQYFINKNTRKVRIMEMYKNL